MGLTPFLTSLGNDYRNRYLNYAMLAQNNPAATPSAPSAPQPTTSAMPSDSFQTSNGSSSPQPTSGETSVPMNPDGTYSYSRTATLDFNLGLRFDLGALTRTVSQIADGQTVPVDQFAAAGFGLTADFDARGIQTIETSGAAANEGSPTESRSKSRLGVRQAGAFQYTDRHLALRAFYRQSLDIRRSLKTEVRNGYTRAVNKFAVRFHMDSNFSLGFAQRFNAQTQAVAAQKPDATNAYVNNAGNLAESGSSEMMGVFFDAVESYLNNAEQNLLQSAGQAFDMAASELGFSGDLVTQAKSGITDSIESFFGKVETAVAAIRSRFVTAPPVEPTSIVSPSVSLPADYLAPASSQLSNQLAVA